MPFAEVDDVRLFYTDDSAGGVPLLFLHGWTCDSHDWSWQLPAFTDHRVVVPDLRGHGRSSVPPGGYTTMRFAEDIVGLLDHLGIEQVVAIGHSMGGAIASALAVHHSQRVSGCVTIDPAFGMPETFGPYVGSGPMGLADEDGPQNLATAMVAMSNEQTPQHLVMWHSRRALAAPLAAARQCIDNLFHGPDAWGLRPASDRFIARRQCPVLAFYPDATRSECEAGTLSGAHDQLVVWGEAGHWMHQERPEEFNAILRAWLSRLP